MALLEFSAEEVKTRQNFSPAPPVLPLVNMQDFCPTKPLLIFSLPFAILCCPAFEAKVCLCGFPSEEPKGSSLNEEGSAAQIGRRSLCAAPQTTASRAGGNEKAFVLSIGRSEMTNH